MFDGEYTVQIYWIIECIDGHNSTNIDAIHLKFESNIFEDI